MLSVAGNDRAAPNPAPPLTDPTDPTEPGRSGAAPAMPRHSWTLTPREAIRLQSELSPLVETDDRFDALRTVAGVDVAYGRRGGPAHAAVTVFRFPDLVLLEQARIVQPATFPYVPGLLSFREAPAVLAALDHVPVRPDLLMVDGQGLAHPRRFGIACHLGVYLDIPTVGVAKSRLTGTYSEPGPERGDWTPLRDGGAVIGAVLRTRSRVKPLFVSIGHRVSLTTAIRLVLACGRGYRLPEPCRIADRVSKQPADE